MDPISKATEFRKASQVVPISDTYPVMLHSSSNKKIIPINDQESNTDLPQDSRVQFQSDDDIAPEVKEFPPSLELQPYDDFSDDDDDDYNEESSNRFGQLKGFMKGPSSWRKIVRWYNSLTYESIKVNIRWLMESATINLSFSVRLFYFPLFSAYLIYVYLIYYNSLKILFFI